jgi:hypothetical protein
VLLSSQSAFTAPPFLGKSGQRNPQTTFVKSNFHTGQGTADTIRLRSKSEIVAMSAPL